MADRYGETCFGCVRYPKGCGKLGECVLWPEEKQVRADVTERVRAQISARNAANAKRHTGL